MKFTFVCCAALLLFTQLPGAEYAGEPVLPSGAIARTKSPGNVQSVALSSNGKFAAFINDDRNIRIWDVERKTTRVLTTKPMEDDEGDYVVAVSPDDKLVACGGFDRQRLGKVPIWDIQTGTLSQTIQGDWRGVVSFAFSPDSKDLAVGGFSTKHLAYQFDVQTGKVSAKFPGHGFDAVATVAISPDGLSLAASGEDGIICIHDRATGKELRRITAGVYAMEFSPDNKRLTAIVNEEVVQWEIATGKELFKWPNSIYWGAISRDARYALGLGDGQLLDLSNGKTVFQERQKKERASGSAIAACAFARDSKRFVTGRSDGTLTIWSVEAVTAPHGKK